MRSPTYLALFASAVAAQSSVTLLQVFPFGNGTLTQIGSDASATTYKNDCTAGGISPGPSPMRPTLDSPSATITPAPTPGAMLARQASASGNSNSSSDVDDDDYNFCEPYTLKQGPSTWEFSFTDPLPGAWTASANCKWQGAVTDADLTCTVSESGFVREDSVQGVSSTVYRKEQVASMDIVQLVKVVTASPTAGGMPGSVKSTGRAAGALAPTAAAFVGGAAGVLAAAFAL